MTDVDPETCTALTILFEGEDHAEAANTFIIQFADGGLDEEIEARMEGQGFKIQETDFSIEKKQLKIVVGK